MAQDIKDGKITFSPPGKKKKPDADVPAMNLNETESG